MKRFNFLLVCVFLVFIGCATAQMSDYETQKPISTSTSTSTSIEDLMLIFPDTIEAPVFVEVWTSGTAVYAVSLLGTRDFVSKFAPVSVCSYDYMSDTSLVLKYIGKDRFQQEYLPQIQELGIRTGIYLNVEQSVYLEVVRYR